MLHEGFFRPEIPDSVPSPQEHFSSPERRIESGEGEIRPHELLLYDDGLQQAKTIMQRNGVHYRRVLRSAAWKSPDGGELPAEWKLAIFEPGDQDNPASPEYVLNIHQTLRSAGITVYHYDFGADGQGYEPEYSRSPGF